MTTKRTSSTPSPTHKERLLKQGIRQFYQNGFHGTSLDTVLAEAGVPKGSFYHHFGSKEGFALAVLMAYHERQQTRLKKWMDAPGLSSRDRLVGYVDELVDSFASVGGKRGCLIGKFSLELAASSEVFSSVLSAMLSTWKAMVERLIREGQDNGDIRQDLAAGELADYLLASIQGALVLDLAHRRVGAMLSLKAVTPALLQPA